MNEYNIILIHYFIYYMQRKKTPLHYSAENGHAAVVEGLIRAGASVNAVDRVSVYDEMNNYETLTYVTSCYYILMPFVVNIMLNKNTLGIKKSARPIRSSIANRCDQKL